MVHCLIPINTLFTNVHKRKYLTLIYNNPPICFIISTQIAQTSKTCDQQARPETIDMTYGIVMLLYLFVIGVIKALDCLIFIHFKKSKLLLCWCILVIQGYPYCLYVTHINILRGRVLTGLHCQ